MNFIPAEAPERVLSLYSLTTAPIVAADEEGGRLAVRIYDPTSQTQIADITLSENDYRIFALSEGGGKYTSRKNIRNITIDDDGTGYYDPLFYTRRGRCRYAFEDYEYKLIASKETLASAADRELLISRFGEFFWDGMSAFIDACNERKKEARIAKMEEELSRFNKMVKPLPKGFNTWSQKVISDSGNILIYSNSTKKKDKENCSVSTTCCGADSAPVKKEVLRKSMQEMKCPICRKHLEEIYTSRKQHLGYFYDSLSIMQPLDKGMICFRYFECRIHYRKDGKKVEKKTELSEVGRSFYRWGKNKKIKHRIREYGNIDDTGEHWKRNAENGIGTYSRWGCHETGYLAWHGKDAILYPYNLNTVLKDTPMRYAPISSYIKLTGKRRYSPEAILNLFDKFPQMELIVKEGLSKVIREVDENLWRQFYWNKPLVSIAFPVEAKSVREMFNLSKEDYRAAKTLNPSVKDLSNIASVRKLNLKYDVCDIIKTQAILKDDGMWNLLSRLSETEASLKSFLAYLTKEAAREKQYSRYDMYRFWVDYMDTSKELGRTPVKKDHVLPYMLKLSHDEVMEERRIKQDEAEARKLKEEMDAATKALSFTRFLFSKCFRPVPESGSESAFGIKGRDDLCVVVPQKGEDIRDEGVALAHCVARYIKPVGENKTSILFLRKTKEPTIPYYTLEWKNNTFTQVYGAHDCRATENVQSFVDGLLPEMLKMENNRQKLEKEYLSQEEAK